MSCPCYCFVGVCCFCNFLCVCILWGGVGVCLQTCPIVQHSKIDKRETKKPGIMIMVNYNAPHTWCIRMQLQIPKMILWGAETRLAINTLAFENNTVLELQCGVFYQQLYMIRNNYLRIAVIIILGCMLCTEEQLWWVILPNLNNKTTERWPWLVQRNGQR